MPTPYSYPYRPEGWATDIYPMPAFTQLAVSDLDRSATWYQQVLGFADVFTMRAADNTPILAHVRWCTFGDVLLVASNAASSELRGRGITLYFSADDVDVIVERAGAHQVVPLDGPGDRPWNAREVTFADPDGYRLTFTAPTAELRARVAAGTLESMDAVVERWRSAFRS
ncbi:MAG TPA: VOC family protein [Gemmatimonadaceae bacterium]|nr:VOC family protein [Gemmatimonadaceae bacterium]